MGLWGGGGGGVRPAPSAEILLVQSHIPAVTQRAWERFLCMLKCAIIMSVIGHKHPVSETMHIVDTNRNDSTCTHTYIQCTLNESKKICLWNVVHCTNDN